MDKRDLLILIAGVAVVVALYLFMHPSSIHPDSGSSTRDAVPTTPTPLPVRTTPTPAEQPSQSGTAPLRITFAKDPYRYSVYTLPSNIDQYGGSDHPWSYRNTAVFAYMEESRGGVTEEFPAIYPIWKITCNVSAEHNPEYTLLQMALMDAESGTLIDAIDIRYPGSAFRIVPENSGAFYLIIRSINVDRYTITLEAPDALAGGKTP